MSYFAYYNFSRHRHWLLNTDFVRNDGMMKTAFLPALVLSLATAAGSAFAVPQAYDLDRGASQIAFTFDLQGSDLTGTVPVQSADVQIDFDNFANSKVDVSFNMQRAQAGVFFATDAMKGASVLDTTRYPTARFTSTRVSPTAAGARLDGNLTLRGVTRPVSLNAKFFRSPGSNPGDVSQLQLALSGQLDRNTFGASGFPELVAPGVDLNVRVNVAKR